MKLSAEFEDIITRERSRSNRSGRPFTLVVWHKHDIADLKKRARQTDYVGWLDAERKTPAILLVNTGLEEAFNFIVAYDRHQNVSYEVHSYPDYWSNDLTSRRFPTWKRVMDVILGSLLLVVLSPLLAFTAVFIKIISPGPVLYTSDRVGYKGRLFKFLKFRTMRHATGEKVATHVQGHREHLRELIRNSDAPMPKLDSKGDARVFFGGGILRRSTIDELPQLINVIRGEMALVGPRPCIPYEAEEFLQWHHGRFDTVPGMTGLWQVSGKNKLSFKQMIRLDIQYARTMSPWVDLKILVRTAPTVVGLAFEATTERLMRDTDDRRDRRNRRDRRVATEVAAQVARRKEDERQKLDMEAKVRYHTQADRRRQPDRRRGEERRNHHGKANGKTAG